MADDMDLSQLRDLTHDLGRVPGYAVRMVEPVVKAAAEDVKLYMTDQAKWSPHFRGMAGSFTYDQKPGIGKVGYVVGPDKSRRGGALGNIFFFGTSRGGGSGDLPGAISAAMPRFERNMARVAAVIARLGVARGGGR
jgi:hypothetical protein